MKKFRKNKLIFSILLLLATNQPITILSGEGNFYNFLSWMDADTKNLIIESSIDAFRSIITYVATGIALISFVYYMNGEKKGKDKFSFESIVIKDTTLADYVGVPVEINKLITQIKNDEHFEGIDLPNGALLLGPPGVGKTYLVRAIAGELKIPFFSIIGSDLLQKYVGDSPKTISFLFAAARKAAEEHAKKVGKKRGVALIGIDEIEELGARNDSEHKNLGLISKLLAEIDGVAKHNVDIIVIATVNNPEGLDPALLRSGRLKSVKILYPDQKNRQSIIDKLFEKIWNGNFKQLEISPENLAKVTDNMSQADLKEMCNNVARSTVISAQEKKVEKKTEKAELVKKFFISELYQLYRTKYEKTLPSQKELSRFLSEFEIDVLMTKEKFFQLTHGIRMSHIYAAVKNTSSTNSLSVSLEEQQRKVNAKHAKKALFFCKSLGFTDQNSSCQFDTHQKVFSHYQISN